MRGEPPKKFTEICLNDWMMISIHLPSVSLQEAYGLTTFISFLERENVEEILKCGGER